MESETKKLKKRKVVYPLALVERRCRRGDDRTKNLDVFLNL